MPKAKVICRYCGYVEQTYLYNLSQEYKCEKCQDKNTDVREVTPEDNNPFGYPKDFK